VFDEPPAWWNDQMERLTPRMAITDPPDQALSLLIRPPVETIQ
jgi:hypothetical protein